MALPEDQGCEEEGNTMSLLEHLQQISDPHSRHRRECPLYALLAMVILAAVHGENSLRGWCAIRH